MNYHNDDWIMARLQEHYDEALKYFPADRIVCLALHGSQNYGLDTAESDVDTELAVVPTLQEIAMNSQPVSTTHIRENNEHIEFKDIRLFIQLFKKQNLAFLETLFTPYCIVNPMYQVEWNALKTIRESIAYYDPCRAVKSMKGVAHTKYEHMERPLHRKSDVIMPHTQEIKQFGYVPKELYHLLRIEEYLTKYIAQHQYVNCLKSNFPEYLQKVKRGEHTLEEARERANAAIENIDGMVESASSKIFKDYPVNEVIANLLDCAQYSIIKTALKNQFCACCPIDNKSQMIYNNNTKLI